MVSYQRRMQSFQRWPQQIAQCPEYLPQSGYSGCGDSVTCFYCGLTLKEWEQSDSINFEIKNFLQNLNTCKWFMTCKLMRNCIHRLKI